MRKGSTRKAAFVTKPCVYKTVGALKLRADVSRPDDALPRPVLIYLHGGALVLGARQDVPPDLTDLCRSSGYILVSPDYRLAPEVRLPRIIEDLRDFIRWVSEKGPELFHADKARIIVCGGSAGGYLTLMAGLCAPRPKALVSYWGYGDVDGPWLSQPSDFYRKSEPLVSKEAAVKGRSATVLVDTRGGKFRQARPRLYLHLRQNGLWTREVTGFDPATERKKLNPYCPVRNVTSQYPPILMLHGTEDTDVPYQESLDMAEALKKNKVRYELITVPGAGHGLSGGNRKRVAQAQARARKFIKENLGAVSSK